MNRMPCRISDGMQFDEWEEGAYEIDEPEDRYDEWRQQEIDDLANKRKEQAALVAIEPEVREA